MSIEKCLLGKVEAGKLTKSQAEELSEEIRTRQEQLVKDMSPADAEAQAALELRELRTFEAERAKILTAKQAITQQNIKNTIDSRDDSLEAALAILDTSLDGRNNDILNVTTREIEVRSTAWSMLADVAENFRSRVPGTFSGNHRMHNDLMRALHGEKPKVYPEVVEYANQLKEVAEWLRKRYNRGGGAIAHRADWGWAHKHSPEMFQRQFREVKSRIEADTPRLKGETKKAYENRIIDLTQERASNDWAKEVLPLLDRNKLLDLDTEKPLSDAQAIEMLKKTYNRIYTDGAIDTVPGGAGKGRKLANQRMERRVLPFKDADAWIGYSEKYSNMNPWQSVVEHIESMSNDIARLEVLGPNPDASIRFMQDTIAQEAARRGEASTSKLGEGKIQRVYDTITGKASIPVRRKTAAYMDDVANVLTGVQLGGASIAAVIGDAGTSKVARRIHGLPHWNFFRNFIQDISSTGTQSINQAARIGIAPDLWLEEALATARFAGDLHGHEWSRRLPNFIFRTTYLSQITQGRSASFTVDLLGSLHDTRALKFEELNPRMRDLMDQFGIGEQHWDVIRKAGVEKYKGAEVLDMASLSRTASTALERDAASRLQQFVRGGRDLAVPTSTARVRSIKAIGGEKGTFKRLASDSFFMYKTFPLTYFHTHIANLGSAQKTKMGTAAIYAELFLLMTLGGALSLQVKEIAKGKDPLPMVDENGIPSLKFIGASILQGGSFGVFGDFIFSDQNRFGRSAAEQVVGPITNAALEATLDLGVGNIQQIIAGEDTRFGPEALKFARRNLVPKPFYTRLATERLILDRLEEFVDDGAQARFDRRVRQTETEFNQGHWWAPGAGLDEVRAPDLSNIVNED